MQQLVEFAGLHALEHGLLVDFALTQQVHSNLHHGGTSALSVTGLQQPEFAVLDGELHVLHVAIVLLEAMLNFHELCGALGHRLLERGVLACALGLADALQLSPTAAALGHDLLRGAHAGHHIFALSVDEVLTVEQVLASSGVARECHAGSAGVAHVAIDHGLHVHCGTIFLGNLVHAAIKDSAVIVPTVKHGVDGAPELVPSAGGEVLAGILLDSSLKAHNEFLEVVDIKFGVELHALLLFYFLDDFLERVDVGLFLGLHAKHHVAVHLHEAAVTIPCKARISRLLGQCLGHSVVDTQVEHGVHHTGHRHGGTRAHRNQLRICGIVELVAGEALDVSDSLFYILANEFHDSVAAVLVVEAAYVCGDGKARRYGHTNKVHLGEVSTFATKKISHVGTAFSLAVTESVNRLH